MIYRVVHVFSDLECSMSHLTMSSLSLVLITRHHGYYLGAGTTVSGFTLWVPPPKMVQFTPHKHQNVLIPGAGMPAVPCTADFRVSTVNTV